MSSIDAPDYQKVIRVVSGGGSVDCPDWEYVVTGPAAAPPITAGGPAFATKFSDAAFFGVTQDPDFSQATVTAAVGIVYLFAFVALLTGSATHVWIGLNSGTTHTANENFMGIYDMGETTASTFTLLGNTAAGACDTPFTTSGIKEIALSSSVALTSGNVYAACLLVNGNSAAALGVTFGLGTLATPLLSTFPWRAVTSSGHTTLPGTIAYSAVTASTIGAVMYVS